MKTKSKTPKTFKTKRSPRFKKVEPISSAKDLPATQGMIVHLQKIIKSEVRALDKKFEAKFTQMDAKIDSVRAEVSALDKKFEAKFTQMESNFSAMFSEIHRIAILIEEQNSRNRFVLEGYEQLYKRQDRLEQDVDRRLKDIEEVISLSRSAK